ncbi:hypothetical protein HOLleu_03444 [Holothuria leucospilota]|uniref:Uncharacterized protein n=1 Tax=Holothuria leucospilota TaxID=206669 RepID=A0A9Q1CTM8_HOLLE|nr:hypothetical protein HOLleu_03444 [Holothuria leucospilota]
MAKSRPKESSRQRQPVVPRQPNEGDTDSDEEDNMPLAYQANTAKAQHELQGESQIKILQDKIDRLETEAITMASELKELKFVL